MSTSGLYATLFEPHTSNSKAFLVLDDGRFGFGLDLIRLDLGGAGLAFLLGSGIVVTTGKEQAAAARKEQREEESTSSTQHLVLARRDGAADDSDTDFACIAKVLRETKLAQSAPGPLVGCT